MTRSRSALVGGTLALAAAVGLLYSAIPALVGTRSERAEAVASLITEAGVALGAAVMLVSGARRLARPQRVAWRLMAAGVASWAMGSVLWLIDALAGREPTTPGPVDLFYLGLVPLVAVGLALHPTPRRNDRVVRSLVDGLLVASSLLMIAWVAVGQGIVDRGAPATPAAIAVDVLYPLTDILLIVMALSTLLQARPGTRLPLGLFALGISFVAASDLVYLVTNASGQWESSPLLLDAGWVVGFVIVGGAGAALDAAPHPGGRTRAAVLDSVVATAPLWIGGVALLVGVVDLSTDRGATGVTVPLLVLLTGLLLLRQGIAVREGRHLASRLARSVERLAREASHDQLTGLPNRGGLAERLTGRRRTADGELAVLFIDIDHLKAVNDSLGHDVGDRLIRMVAERLTQLLGAEAVTRFGGDEFVTSIEADDRDRVAAAAELLVEQATALDGGGSLPVVPSLSVGLAFWDDGLGAEEVMRRADTALFRAKQLGRRRVVRYEPALDESTRRRVALEPELARAIAAGELVVHYQPVFDLHTGALRGAEALVRWNHPGEGTISPEEFLGHADAAGLLERIGDHVLDTAVADFAELNRRGDAPPLEVAVNMSASELAAVGAARRVHDALSRHGLDPACLTVEITEDVVVDETTRRTIDQLRDLGVSIAIDDFGTGNSSLRQLGSYPATTLKVDRSFIGGLGRDPEDTVVVRAILNLARNLGLGTVAEGVEREEQIALLRELGCDAAQGWFYDRALPLERLRDGLRRPPPPRDRARPAARE